MSWLSKGEADRLKPGSQWSATIDDLCDLMFNYPNQGERDRQKEYATRAISFVLSNLGQRNIIDDKFIDIGDNETV